MLSVTPVATSHRQNARETNVIRVGGANAVVRIFSFSWRLLSTVQVKLCWMLRVEASCSSLEVLYSCTEGMPHFVRQTAACCSASVEAVEDLMAGTSWSTPQHDVAEQARSKQGQVPQTCKKVITSIDSNLGDTAYDMHRASKV